MRILLVGEYSRLHNSLKQGLVQLGHEVLLVSDGDGFKQYPSDLSYAATWWNKKPMYYLRQVLFRLFGHDVTYAERGRKFRRLLPKLRDFDVVQLINEAPIKTIPTLELKLLAQLIGQNKKTFLLCCGIDYTVLEYMQSGGAKYTLLDEYRADSRLKPHFNYIFEYGKPGHRKIHEYLYRQVNGIIASDMDYLLALKGQPKFLGMIPNPVLPPAGGNTPQELGNRRIVIFLGINSWTRYQKGIRYFEEALETISRKYPDRTEIIITENLPYHEYIKHFRQADIVLDQVYAYDQGYNALEAMALGKVVFTGAETEFYDHYTLTDRVAVNAIPDARAIASALEALIEHPEEITAIGRRAREFVRREHDHLAVAAKYLLLWNTN